MRRISRSLQHGVLIGLLVLIQAQLLAQVSPSSTADATAPRTSFAALPLAFEPNQGQADPSVDFLVHHGQAVTTFSGTTATTTSGGARATLTLAGADPSAFTGQDRLPSVTNYFVGNDQAQWHPDIPNYQRLVAQDVYPGIDLRYYGTASQLEHDFVVRPGADYHDIAFTVAGGAQLDEAGNLVLGAGEGGLRLNAPVSYQGTEAAKHTVASRFVLDGDTVQIVLGDGYDPAQTLTIDPTLVYSTYFGGTATDYGARNAVDPDGNVYVVGMTTGTGLPTTAPYQATYGGGTFDTVVMKFDKTGTAPIYTTYLGGSGDDRGAGIATDLAGNAYVSGLTDSANFPTAAAYQGTKAAGQDAFLTKLNPSGSALTYSTYFGGNGNDYSQNLAVDGSGQAFLVGDTSSTDLPTLSAVQPAAPGNDDSFVAKFNTAGSALLYATYVGGAASGEQTFGIAINNAGNAYLTGYTHSSNFPTVAAFQPTNGGGTYEGFVAELSTDGSSYVFATYLGGSGDDEGGMVALDSAGNIYVTGQTDSPNFPTASPYQAALAGSRDAFVSKFNPSGSALLFSTYLGGSGSDVPQSVVVDASNNAYVSGLTDSANFPTVAAYQATKAAGQDAFLTKLDSTGSALAYSTYLGGNGIDTGSSLALRLDGDLMVVGSTSSTDFVTHAAYQGSNGGGQDMFLMQLSDHTVTVTGVNDPILTFSLGAVICDMGTFSATETKYCTHTMSAGTNANSGYVISYIPTTTLTSGPDTIDPMPVQTWSTQGTEQFGLNVAANAAVNSGTAADFGANPSGGSGFATTDYQSGDLYKFTTAGDTVAQATSVSDLTTYTVSFITNITTTSEAGTYSTPITYTIVATY